MTSPAQRLGARAADLRDEASPPEVIYLARRMMIIDTPSYALGGKPEAFAAQIKAKLARWVNMVKQANNRAD